MRYARWLAVLLAMVGLGCQSSTLTAAKLYIKQEQPQKAKEQLLDALKLEPENAEAHFRLGKLFAAEGRYVEMVEHMDRSAGLSPKFQTEIEQTQRHFWAREYNAGVSYAQGEEPNFAKALHAFHNATLIEEGDLKAWRNLAYVYYQIDSTDAAIATYQKIVSADSQDANSYYSLGVLYLNQGRHQEAVRVLSQLVRIDPQHLDGHINLAVAQVHLEDYEGAAANYRKAIAIAPESPDSYYNLGNLYWQQKNYTAALKAYEKTVELKPEDADALYNLAITRLALEDMDGALPLLQQLSEKTPDNASVWRKLGRIYAHKGMIKESEAAYAREEELGE
jgi:tetratricopeptide (TPR) repeat protein